MIEIGVGPAPASGPVRAPDERRRVRSVDADGTALRDRIQTCGASRHPSSSRSRPGPSSTLAFVDVEASETFVQRQGSVMTASFTATRRPRSSRRSPAREIGSSKSASLSSRRGRVTSGITGDADGSAEFDGSALGKLSAEATLVSAELVIWTRGRPNRGARRPGCQFCFRTTSRRPSNRLELPPASRKAHPPPEAREPTWRPFRGSFPDLRANGVRRWGRLVGRGRRAPPRRAVGLRVDSLSVSGSDVGRNELALGSGAFRRRPRRRRRIELAFSTSPLGHGPHRFSLRADLADAIGGDCRGSRRPAAPSRLGSWACTTAASSTLLDVDHTTFAGRGRVVLDDKASKAVTFDVEGAVHGLSMRDPRLAHDPVRGTGSRVFSARGLSRRGQGRVFAWTRRRPRSEAARATPPWGFQCRTPDHAFQRPFDFDFPHGKL